MTLWNTLSLGLSGHPYDRQTGMTYMHYRYYHSRLGHFINPYFRAPGIYDPSTFKHPYAYANVYPIMFWDPESGWTRWPPREWIRRRRI